MLINETVEQLRPRLKNLFTSGRNVPLPHTTFAASVFLAHAISQACSQTVVHISDTMESLDTAHRDLHAMFPDHENNLMYFPANETLFNKSEGGDPEILGFRLNAMNRLMNMSDLTEPYVITTCIQAMMQKCLLPSELKTKALHLTLGDTIETEAASNKLIDIGYNFAAKVTQKSQACIRGGLLDLWPPSETWPIRIELFGTSIESIRQFDPETQMSVGRINELVIMPAFENSQSSSKRRTSILSFLPENSIILWSDYESISDYADMLEESVSDTNQNDAIVLFKTLTGAISRNKKLFQIKPSNTKTGPSKNMIPAFEAVIHPVKLEPLTDNIKNGHQSTIYMNTEGSLKHFIKNNKTLSKLKVDNLDIRQGILSEGFQCDEMNFSIIAESDLHGHRKLIDHSYHPYPGKRRPSRSIGHRISDFNNLEPGDLVVHNEYGLGQYQGLFEINFNGRLQEVLTIEYANKAKLHVPVSHSNLLTRYVGTSRGSARLHRLHGQRWATIKEEAEESVLDLAASLLETQAARDLLEGHAFKPDTQWQMEFEASFPYHETPDQHKVIADVKCDMES